MAAEGPHAIRWYRREVRYDHDFTKWHWTVDAAFTACGRPIPAAEGCLNAEYDDLPEVVDCQRCLAVLSSRGRTD